MKPRVSSRSFASNEELLKNSEIFGQSYPVWKAYILGLVRELDPSGQRRMAQTLELPFSRRKTKKWPQMMFIKDVHVKLQEAQQDYPVRMRWMKALFECVSSLFADDESASLETFLSREEEIVSQHGFWHYYWGFMLYPCNDDEGELWEYARRGLEEQAAGLAERAAHHDGEIGWDTKGTEDPAKSNGTDNPDSSKVKQLEKKLTNETELRLRLEHELAQCQKMTRRQDKELLRIGQWLQEAKKQGKQHLSERDEAVERLDRERSLFKEAQLQWQRDKEVLLEQISSLDRLLRQQEKLAAGLKERLHQEQSAAMLREASSAVTEPQLLVRQLVQMLNKELERLSSQLSRLEHPASGHELRQQIRKNINFQDVLETYGGEALRTSPGAEYTEAAEDSASSIPLPHGDPSESSVSGKLAQAAEEAESVYMGTFYRRDHGGYICLESGEDFNITESMVCNLNLQHEAEVQCRPQGTTDQGTLLYEIELLFQGDDAFAPIKQYEGYIELGEHHVWYCVELNNPDNRYPVHYKDIEKQHPLDGTPCVFNIGEESSYARLSRLYRDFTPFRKTQQLKESTVPRVPERSAPDKNGDKQKSQPFLEGCLIAIVGGQRKWFEEVVQETGAELIHDTGDNPQRLTSVLPRAHALFMLLTSTSHRATWSAVETAKQCGIPHFTIQGSKSNLRSQLWDNRKVIKAEW